MKNTTSTIDLLLAAIRAQQRRAFCILVFGLAATTALAEDAPTSLTPQSVTTISEGTNTSLPADQLKVVATVDGANVTLQDLTAALSQLDSARRAQVVRSPELLARLVQSAAMQKVVLKEALSKKWDQEPAVKALIERARDEAIADSYIVTLSAPPAGYPGDAEVQACYDANKSKLMTSPQYHLAQIHIKIPKDASQAAADRIKSRVEDIRKQLANNENDFAAIAREESDEKESAARGGEIGWVEETKVPLLILTQVSRLEVNGISDPVLLDDGWHIVKLLQTRQPTTQPLDVVRNQIALELRAERTRQNREAYLEKLLQQNPVTIDSKVLESLANSATKK